MKYRDFVGNPDAHFKNAQIFNFDIIHHDCTGDQLENFIKTIYKKEFKGYSQKENKRYCLQPFCLKKKI